MTLCAVDEADKIRYMRAKHFNDTLVEFAKKNDFLLLPTEIALRSQMFYIGNSEMYYQMHSLASCGKRQVVEYCIHQSSRFVRSEGNEFRDGNGRFIGREALQIVPNFRYVGGADISTTGRRSND